MPPEESRETKGFFKRLKRLFVGMVENLGEKMAAIKDRFLPEIERYALKNRAVQLALEDAALTVAYLCTSYEKIEMIQDSLAVQIPAIITGELDQLFLRAAQANASKPDATGETREVASCAEAVFKANREARAARLRLKELVKAAAAERTVKQARLQAKMAEKQAATQEKKLSHAMARARVTSRTEATTSRSAPAVATANAGAVVTRSALSLGMAASRGNTSNQQHCALL